MDVISNESIRCCVEEAIDDTGGRFDYLVNEAGGNSSICPMLPLHRLSFLSNRIKGGIVVNRTAITSVVPFLFSGPYNASKAAISTLSDMMCLGFGPLDVQAVDLKTGTFKPKLVDKLAAWKLPKGLAL